MEVKTPFMEVSEAIVASGADTLFWCMQCGLCTGSCPWRLVQGRISEAFNIRKVQRLGQLGLEGFESEEVIYACTTCGQCVIRCPREVKIIDNVRGMRSMLASVGTIPGSYRPVIGGLHSQGNPWSGEREKRTEWMQGLDVPQFDEGKEYFLFICCTSCYDVRSQAIARSVAQLLTMAEVSFGVIGKEESCCGEAVRKIGDEEAFAKLAQQNISLLSEKGVRRIIATSPHSVYTYKNEYPELGGEFEIIHHTEILAQLIKEGRLKPKKRPNGRVTYHDPCYLGRHNGIYDAPREILEAVCGDEFVELDRIRTNSLCCGGGGGRIWMETAAGERFGDLRIEEALGKEAATLATACPYCVIMLESSCKTMAKDEVLAIKDVSEVLLEAVT
jgi:Fe-S oxidoreductase